MPVPVPFLRRQTIYRHVSCVADRHTMVCSVCLSGLPQSTKNSFGMLGKNVQFKSKLPDKGQPKAMDHHAGNFDILVR